MEAQPYINSIIIKNEATDCLETFDLSRMDMRIHIDMLKMVKDQAKNLIEE
jgi:hypothetical protein